MLAAISVQRSVLKGRARRSAKEGHVLGERALNEGAIGEGRHT